MFSNEFTYFVHLYYSLQANRNPIIWSGTVLVLLILEANQILLLSLIELHWITNLTICANMLFQTSTFYL